MAIIRKMHSLNQAKNEIGGNTYIDELSIIGDYTYIGTNCLVSRAEIGRYCSIGPGEHHVDWISTSACIYNNRVNWYDELTKDRVVVGNDVWIGTDSIIKRGVSIGDGAIVGANSFVNKDVPPFAIVGGTPARLIRYRFNERKIERIVESEWWNKPLAEAREIVKQLEELEC